MEKLSFFLYLFVLVIAPLLFGAVHTYAYTFVFLLIFSATFLLFCDHFKKNGLGEQTPPFPPSVFTSLFFTLLCYFVLQIIPLPEAAISFLSPETQKIAEKSLITIPGETSSFNKYLTLAPYTYPVQMSIIRWVAYSLFFLGFSRTLSSRSRIETAITCILATACLVSLYGIFQTYSGSHHIWWFTKTAYVDEVTGTYINRNHFASFMGMALILAASFSASFTKPLKQKKQGFRDKLQNFLDNQQSISKKLLIISTAAVIGFGLILSASRAGILSATAGLFFMAVLFLFKENQRRNALLALTIFFLILIISVFAGIEHPWDRFQELTASREVRARYAQTTLDLFSHFPWFGVGLGNFRYAYPKFQSGDDSHSFIEYAHNDWIQFLAETGLIGFFLLSAALLLVLFIFMRLWLKEKEPYLLALGTAPLALFVTIGIHSYYDFNLHLPANFIIMSAIVAIGYKSLTHGLPTSDQLRPSSPRIKSLFLLGLYIFIICVAGLWSIRHFMAESNCNTVQNSTFKRDRSPSEVKIGNAISWHKDNATYWYKLSREMQKDREDRTEETDIQIIQTLVQAIRLNPNDAEYYLALGKHLQDQVEKNENSADWQKAADTSMESAAFFIGGKNPWQHKDLGDYWLKRSLHYPDGSEKWKNMLTKSLAHYKKALSIRGDYWKKMLYDAIEKTISRHYRNTERPDFMHLPL